jgi:hypothetical protein
MLWVLKIEHCLTWRGINGLIGLNGKVKWSNNRINYFFKTRLLLLVVLSENASVMGVFCPTATSVVLKINLSV